MKAAVDGTVEETNGVFRIHKKSKLSTISKYRFQPISKLLEYGGYRLEVFFQVSNNGFQIKSMDAFPTLLYAYNEEIPFWDYHLPPKCLGLRENKIASFWFNETH